MKTKVVSKSEAVKELEEKTQEIRETLIKLERLTKELREIEVEVTLP
ncbi:hypothetical protein [Orenia marismortui]|uniref:Uncharacterized protein n=1 Tax=Orenia marismortui TaxID=46469 RepID=A0A4R8H547_9FIRM|nr:hypothetical protein [Orenia marismortui]TDX52175.1 hypothetical protein C7959_10897 [Orenia marismortui]